MTITVDGWHLRTMAARGPGEREPRDEVEAGRSGVELSGLR